MHWIRIVICRVRKLCTENNEYDNLNESFETKSGNHLKIQLLYRLVFCHLALGEILREKYKRRREEIEVKRGGKASN